MLQNQEGMSGDVVELLLGAFEKVQAYQHSQHGVLHRLAESESSAAPAVAKALLALGLDVNDADHDDQLTPLHIAARLGSAAMVETFLAAGASVTALSAHDQTPLHCVGGPLLRRSCGGDRAEIVRLLLDAGASLTATDADGRTPLLVVAGSSSSYEIRFCLEALLAAGADVHATDNEGMGVLHLLALYPSHEFLRPFEVLIRAGADVKATCNAGLQPVHYAVNPCGKRFGRYYREWYDSDFNPIFCVMLIDHGADLLAPSPLGSPLALALSTEAGDTRYRQEMATIIIECIAFIAPSRASDVLRAVHHVSTPLEPWFFSTFLSSFSTVLTEAQWFALSCLVRDPPGGLGRFLPAALACSSLTARDFMLFVVPPADAKRLRTFALCLNRLQRTPQHPASSLSADIVRRILSLSLSDV
jgi:hypothetical protein